MRTIRIIGLAAIVGALTSAAPSTALRKDFVVLKIATRSGDSSTVRLTTRGLIHVEARQAAGRRLPWQVITKHPVPTEMRLAGVGEAFLTSVDSTDLLLVVQHSRTNPPAEQRLTGRAFRISRQGADPFRVEERLSPPRGP